MALQQIGDWLIDPKEVVAISNLAGSGSTGFHVNVALRGGAMLEFSAGGNIEHAREFRKELVQQVKGRPPTMD
jgi:hypothetical protein